MHELFGDQKNNSEEYSLHATSHMYEGGVLLRPLYCHAAKRKKALHSQSRAIMGKRINVSESSPDNMPNMLECFLGFITRLRE